MKQMKHTGYTLFHCFGSRNGRSRPWWRCGWSIHHVLLTTFAQRRLHRLRASETLSALLSASSKFSRRHKMRWEVYFLKGIGRKQSWKCTENCWYTGKCFTLSQSRQSTTVIMQATKLHRSMLLCVSYTLLHCWFLIYIKVYNKLWPQQICRNDHTDNKESPTSNLLVKREYCEKNPSHFVWAYQKTFTSWYRAVTEVSTTKLESYPWRFKGFKAFMRNLTSSCNS